MTCQAGLAAVLMCAAFVAQAQASAQNVQWQLQVVRDGRTIDTFDGSTAIGQAVTATHHHETVHDVGCKNTPAAQIDLARTLTISPMHADASGVTLAIDAQETIEDDVGQRTIEGCTLPPQPRRVTATHPGLEVPAGQWASWTIVDARPTLIYRVRAGVAPH